MHTRQRAHSYPSTDGENLYTLKRKEYPYGGEDAQMERYDLKFLNDCLDIGRDLGGETLEVTKNSTLKGIKGTKNPPIHQRQ